MKSPASIFFWDYLVYVDMSVFHMLRTYDVDVSSRGRCCGACSETIAYNASIL